MTDKTPIHGSRASHAVGFLSMLMAGMAGRSGKKPNELHAEFEAAIALGLFLASKHPELIEAYVQHWNSTRATPADQYLEGLLQAYLDFTGKKGR